MPLRLRPVEGAAFLRFRSIEIRLNLLAEW